MIIMKKIMFVAVFCLTAVSANAQVDNFEVGPYEVEYQKYGDYKYRLQKDVDLYKFFNLKKDTTIVVEQAKPKVISHAWQIGAELMGRLWGFVREATQASVFAQYKLKIGTDIYFNGGVSLGYQANRCIDSGMQIDADILEAGIPLSIEYADLKQKSSSLFVLAGIIPTYSTTLSQKLHEGNDLGKSHGIRIDPRIEFGTYVPVGNILCRLGLFFQKGISLSNSDPDGIALDYKLRTSRVTIGGNVSFVF